MGAEYAVLTRLAPVSSKFLAYNPPLRDYDHYNENPRTYMDYMLTLASPLARRKIWEILLKERGERTMLLTTHFLDETEILSDHVAVLSKGKLKAEGPVAALKSRLGGGYHVILPNQESSYSLRDLPPGITHNREYNAIVLDAPDAPTLTPLFAVLERSGISDYRVRGPTIEDVFLRLAEEMKTDESEVLRADTSRVTESGARDLHSGLAKGTVPTTMKLNTGKGCGPVRQTGILLLKRLTVLKHNFMPYVSFLHILHF